VGTAPLLHFVWFAALLLIASSGALVGEWSIRIALAGFLFWLYQQMRKSLSRSRQE
jgi:hypothetical protein